MIDLAQIAQLDALAMRAVPAREVVEIDGWAARRTLGLATRRVNSVLARSEGTLTLAQRLSAIEHFYGDEDLDARFQLTPAARPAGLRERLLERGYTAAEPTAVQTLSLDARRAATVPGADVLVQVSPEPTTHWWAAWRAALSVEPGRGAPIEQLLARIEPPAVYVAVTAAGQMLGVGMGVLEDGWLGIFNMATAPAQRRRGAASAALTALLGWAQRQGATGAYLQVAVANTPALKLYARHGFREAYRYEYLTRPAVR